ncbi:Ig-like domain-containing protein, partial [Deinococcus sp. RIT780]
MALKPSSVGSALLLGTLLIGCGTTSTPSDTTAPTVTLTATPNPVTTEAANNLTLKADARDATGVTRVEFFEGSTKISEDTTAPFEFTTSVTAVNNGKRTYTATAYDAAGNKASGSTEVTVAITANTAPLRGTVVDQNIGAPVAGSTITVSRAGTVLGTVTTGADGTFTLSGLSAGTYDLRARKTGMAGSDLYGVVVGTETPSVSLVQRPAFETSATTNPATLVITRADGSPI